MKIRVYLHRTKKKQFAVADAFIVNVDLDKLPEDKKEDIDYINKGFYNDCRSMALCRDVVKKFGTGYISFMRPQYEGKEENGNDKIYFDNNEMLFKLKEEVSGNE